MSNDPAMAGVIKTHVSSGSRRIRSTMNPFGRSLICAIYMRQITEKNVVSTII